MDRRDRIPGAERTMGTVGRTMGESARGTDRHADADASHWSRK
jgi:hypothetical protein